MSHAVDWHCRSEACRTPLGRVRDGVLYPLVAVEFIDARGMARLRCRGCGAARLWFPPDAAARKRGDNLLDSRGAVAGPLRLHAAGMAT